MDVIGKEGGQGLDTGGTRQRIRRLGGGARAPDGWWHGAFWALKALGMCARKRFLDELESIAERSLPPDME